MEAKKFKQKLYEFETQNCKKEDEANIIAESSQKVLFEYIFICIYSRPYIFVFLNL